MQKLIRTLAALVLVVFAVSTALPRSTVYAAEPPLTEEEAAAALQEYGVVRGDETGNLRLDSPITRAEAAAIFVRAMGAADYVHLLTDVVPFKDARGHWGAGEIAAVERLGLMKGDGNGLFRPNDRITYAEVLTVMLRMVGREPVGPWNPDAILSRASALGIAPSGVNASSQAVRSKVFWSLAATITTIPLQDDTTLAQRNLDHRAPDLSLDPVASSTSDEKVTIRGKTKGAFRVFVNGAPAQLNRKDQTFTYSAALDVGMNRLEVEAVDAAGNRTAETLTIERRGAVSRITITGPKSIAANTATKLTVTAQDRNGNPLPLEGAEAEVTGIPATFDVATTTLVTGSQTGNGTLTLRAGSARQTFTFTVVAPSPKGARLVIQSINRDVPIALNTEQTVTVRVVDESGKVVSDDYGRSISLHSSGPAGVIITPINPTTDRGVATFRLVGTSVGLTTLTASTAGLESGTRSLEVLTNVRVMLVPSSKSLMPDGTSSVTIKAVLEDAAGRRVNNTSGADIHILLTATGTDSVLSTPYLSIGQGKSDSGTATAKLTAGISPGVVSISGKFISSHDYAIQTLQFPVNTPLGGARLEVTASPATVAPNGQTSVRVRVVDGSGRLVTAGSYAFQLKVTSSNNEAIVRGLPQGVSLSFPNSLYYPVDDGVAANQAENDPYSVVGRTYRGEATVVMSYPRSGVITVQAVPVAATYEAYNPNTGLGPASPSTDLWALPMTVTFQGQPDHIELTADSVIGRDLKAGAVGGAATMTLRARVVDANGMTVPGYKEVITLSRVGGDQVSSVVGIHQRAAVNGVVEFPIQAKDQAGTDQYRVEAEGGRLKSQTVTVSVRKGIEETPTVVAIRGVLETAPNYTANMVGPDAVFMDIQLKRLDGPSEPPYWVLAKVYRQNESTPFFTQTIDLRAPTPTIRVPRNLLRVGRDRYRVIINNGYGDTAYSSTLDAVTEALVASYNDNYRLLSATYDAETGRLFLHTSGLWYDGSIDKTKLSIVKDNHVISLASDEVTLTGYAPVVVNLGSLAASLNPDVWHGAVYVKAEPAWFVDRSGTTVARAFPSAPLTPMAVITDGALDLTSKRLYLNGVGFTQGSIQWNLVQVRTSDSDFVPLRLGYDAVTQLSDTQAIITLSDVTYQAIKALPGTDYYVTASRGWIQTSAGGQWARGSEIAGTNHPVLLRVLATAAQYDPGTDTLTLTGSGGFKGLQLDPNQLVFKLSPGDPGWSPSKSAVVVAAADGSVTVALHPDDAAILESAPFAGNSIYLNTNPGWLSDPMGKRVKPLPDHSILLFVPLP